MTKSAWWLNFRQLGHILQYIHDHTGHMHPPSMLNTNLMLDDLRRGATIKKATLSYVSTLIDRALHQLPPSTLYEDPAIELIQQKIRHCYHLANAIRLLLHEALDLANDMDYDPHWIAAINTASQNSELVWLDTHNIAICIDPTEPITPRKQP